MRLVNEKVDEEKRRQRSELFMTFSGGSSSLSLPEGGGGKKGMMILQPFLQDMSLSKVYPMTLRSRVLSHPPIRKAIKLFKALSRRRYIVPRVTRKRPAINKFSLDLNDIQQSSHKFQARLLRGVGYSSDDSSLQDERRLSWLNEQEFLQAYRMSTKAFYRLLSLIEDHDVFKKPQRGLSQAPVKHQLMTLLHYLSSSGSAAGGARTRNHFYIAYGCKDLYVQRCVAAIRACLRQKYYTWPDEEERKQLAEQFHREYHLPNALLVVDGTTFRFATKPLRKDAADYNGRKDGYTLTNLFFSDCKRRIRYYIAGWAGCAHDNRLWTTCKIYRNASDYFAPQHYLIGDSAFENGPHMVTTYRNPTGGTLRGTKQRFNELLSSPRVLSEHVNGILKGRWPWLSSIPCLLTERKASMRWILKVLDTIVILHNFLTEENLNDDEQYFMMFDEPEPLDENDILNHPLEQNAPCGERREQLRAYLNELNII